MIVPSTVLLAQVSAAQPSGEVAACGPVESANAICVAVYRSTGNSLAARVSETLVVKPAKIALIVGVAFLAQRVVRRGIRRFVQGMQGDRVQRGLGTLRDHTPPVLLDTGQTPSVRRAQRAETIGALLRSAASLTIWSIASLMAMAELGLNLGPLIAGAGIVGVALGFGAQHLVRDFVSGVFMLVEDQYGVGDVIDVGEATGTVEGVSLRTTRLRDVNGTVWHVPNGQIDRVGNTSQQWARAVIDVDVAYETDIPHATEVIKRTADEMWSSQAQDEAPRILEEPEVWGVENLGADGIAIRLVVKTAPGAHFGVARELRARLKAAFDGAGIEIPFPQRTVWHRMRDDGTALVPVTSAHPSEDDGDGDG